MGVALTLNDSITGSRLLNSSRVVVEAFLEQYPIAASLLSDQVEVNSSRVIIIDIDYTVTCSLISQRQINRVPF